MTNYNTNTNQQMPGEKPFTLKKLPGKHPRTYVPMRKTPAVATSGTVHHKPGCGGNHTGSC